MAENNEKKKSLFEGMKKMIFGGALTAVGIVMCLKGQVDLGKYLIGVGIVIAVGGNIYDHETKIREAKINNKKESEVK